MQHYRSLYLIDVRGVLYEFGIKNRRDNLPADDDPGLGSARSEGFSTGLRHPFHGFPVWCHRCRHRGIGHPAARKGLLGKGFSGKGLWAKGLWGKGLRMARLPWRIAMPSGDVIGATAAAGVWSALSKTQMLVPMHRLLSAGDRRDLPFFGRAISRDLIGQRRGDELIAPGSRAF